MQPIRVKTVQESDLRMLGNLARNIQRVLPVTQADIDAAAALGKGWVVWKVFEVSEPLDNMRGGTQLIIRQNSIQPGQNVRRVIFVSGPGGQTVVIRGTDYIVLPDAIADSLSYVKAFGGTEQNGTPTPTTPVDIVSNNGVVKYGYKSVNMFDKNTALAEGLMWNANGQKVQNPDYYGSNIMHVIGGHTYTRTTGTGTDNIFQLKNGTLTRISSNSATITAPENAVNWRYNYKKSVDRNAVMVVKGTSLPDEYVPYKGYGIYTDGTVETIKDSLNNTATAEMLLKVGGYKDEQNINTGAITRRVGVKVLDGTENWTKSSSRAGLFYSKLAFPNITVGDVLCTHMPYAAKLIKGYIYSNNGELNFWTYFDDFTTAEQFKSWLADQYAAGTPVIVVYPLETPTTGENVTAQTLQVQDGDNTLEITQASLTGLELEAQYLASVSLTIQEVQDANLDPNVEVTIN